MKQLLLKGIRKITDEGTLDINEANTDISGQKTQTPGDHSDCQSSDLPKDVSDRKDIVQERKDTSSSPETETSEVCGMKEYGLLVLKGSLKPYC